MRDGFWIIAILHAYCSIRLSIRSFSFFFNAKFDTKSESLAPLDIPQHCWQDITVDFVTGLLEVEEKDAACVVVDRLTKERYIIILPGC